MRSVSTVLALCACLFLHQHAVADTPPHRIAFAISGGASKGAYEAGLNWAFVKLIRQETEHRDTTLLGTFRPFELSAMAGASAGGINTLLSGLSWCVRPEAEGGFANRIDDNIFRYVWLLPDINDLLPARPDSPVYRDDDAVLSRSGLYRAAEFLREKWRSPSFRRNCRVPLGVTVTRVVPEALLAGDVEVENQRFAIPFELSVRDDTTVSFQFNPSDYLGTLDHSTILLPQEAAVSDFAIVDSAIMDAVLTTSAFPVAFGRKRLSYCRLAARYMEEAAPLTPAATPQPQWQCPEGYELDRAEFADGGLFDNLPIGLARVLAEDRVDVPRDALPVSYVYLDPNRTRYQQPKTRKFEACYGANPPAACDQMEYSFSSESSMLLGALGSARRYELYRELTSDRWAYNLSSLSYELADSLAESTNPSDCNNELPFFEGKLDCSQALRYAGRLLEIAYDRTEASITSPFSVQKLARHGLAKRCHETRAETELSVQALCVVDYAAYRRVLAQRLSRLVDRLPGQDENLAQRIRKAALAMENDRILRVTSRGAPITGTLLEDFGAFLELKFREYDYYTGIYDAVISASKITCELHFSMRYLPDEFKKCWDGLAADYAQAIALQDDARGSYVFAMLAKAEFGATGGMAFAYEPMPEQDRDMQIIHVGLAKTLEVERARAAGLGQRSVEVEFFEFLKAEGFSPTPTEDNVEPLLTQIMSNPELWAYELTRRFTDRLMYLEKEAERIVAEREPDPDKRPDSWSTMLGATSLALRAGTYRYHPFEFSPSTAPADWIWRNVIPYEVAFDAVQGDFQVVWQPTWSLSPRDLLGVRGTLGIAQGLLGGDSIDSQGNYIGAGLDYTRLTEGTVFSSLGMTPTYYHLFNPPQGVSRDTFGGDVHVGLLANRLRLGLGARDFNNAGDTWFLLIGFPDIPGIFYWLTR